MAAGIATVDDLLADIDVWALADSLGVVSRSAR